MKGKVFKGSTDIYQDQAKVLFDFYKDAAEKIVAKEIENEKQVENTQSELNAATVELGKTNTMIIVGWVLVIVLIGIFMLVKNKSKKKQLEAEIESLNQRLEDLAQAKKDIFTDYKVDQIGVTYIPVAKKIPFNGKSILIDYSGSVDSTTFTMETSNNPQALTETLVELDNLATHAPIVESSKEVESVETDEFSSSIQNVKFSDYFGRLDRTLRAGTYYMSDISTEKVSLPLIKENDENYKFLKEYATVETEQSPVVNVFNMDAYNDDVKKFDSLNQTRKDLQAENTAFEDTLKHLISNVGIGVQTVASMKVASNNQLIETSNKLLYTILKNSYNHYSPLLAHDEIENMRNATFDYNESVESYKPFNLKKSSRVLYDVESGQWVAEDGSATSVSFGISQIQEEIISPIVQYLLDETRTERLRIYNDIKNQKINYLNQWHQDTEDFYGRNRQASDDLLNIMRSNLTKFIAGKTSIENLEAMRNQMREQMLESDSIETFKTSKKKEKDDLALSIAAFENQEQQIREVQEAFDDYMERLKDDIDERSVKFGFIEYYDASLRDQHAKNLINANDNVSSLDERRKPLASINPLFAQESVLPPAPSVDSIVDEFMNLNVADVATKSINGVDKIDNTLEKAPAPKETQTPVEATATPEEGQAPAEPVATPEEGQAPAEPVATPEEGQAPAEPIATPKEESTPTVNEETSQAPETEKESKKVDAPEGEQPQKSASNGEHKSNGKKGGNHKSNK